MRSLTRRELLRTGLNLAAVSAVAGGLGCHRATPGAVDAAAASSAAPNASIPWYRRTLVGIEVGPTGANDHDQIYMSRMTGKEIVENLVKARAEYGVVFMRDMSFTYYNSKLSRRCPNLGDRDLLRECIDEAKKHNIPIVAYCQVQYDTATWKAQPDWRMKGADGKELDSRLCYNSGYLDFIEQCAAEMMEYEIAGFHFDMLDFGFGPPYGCWCDHCRAAFHAKYSSDMPAGVTWDEAWDRMLEFRADSNTRFCQELQNFVHAKRPEISVDYNYHGYPPFSWIEGERPVQHALNGDFVTAEGLPSIFGHNNPSLLALFMAGARIGGPAQGVTSRSIYNYHDFTVRPVAEMEWEVMTYLAHGAQCTIVDKANYDGSLDPVAYERMGQVFANAISKREFFGHAPVQDVGLYYSSRSRDWFAREDAPKYFAAFSGAHKALVQSHIPFGMLMDENVTAERLRGFPVVYLPNAAILSENEIALLTTYVRDGGNLLVTGQTGLYDRLGKLQQSSSITELIGARLVSTQLKYPDNYLRLPKALAEGESEAFTLDIPPDWPLLTWGPFAVYEPTTAKAFGELMVAYRSRDNQWENLMSPEKVAGPAIFVNEFGKGKVICVPCALDEAISSNYRAPEHRILIRNLIRYLHPQPEIVIDAPLNVETVVTQDATRKRLLVHFLCFSAPPTTTAAAFPNGKTVLPPIMEEPAYFEAVIQLRERFSSIRVTNANGRFAKRGREILIGSHNIHEVAVIDL